jgi:predicted SAM-dependent methyltransferase
MRAWAKVNGTVLLAPLSRRTVRRLLASGDAIRLNLGSGPERIPGWTSVDILGMGADLHWDLRRGIPFPDEAVHAVFLEHVLEHFPIEDVFGILEECRRVLVPHGIVRVGVPDFGRYMESYAGDREFVERLRPGRPTSLLAVAEVALHHGHRSVWDGETLELLLREVGFSDASVQGFGHSVLEPAPDTPMRAAESVYAEARKPAN